MRILVLSNFYPPHYIGGYELGCHDVVEGLRARGHEVEVLTSDYGVAPGASEDGVHRTLQRVDGWRVASLPKSLRRLIERERAAATAFHALADRLNPDVVSGWNLWELPLSLLTHARRRGLPVSLYISDDWLTRWQDDPWHKIHHQPDVAAPIRLLRPLLRPLGRPDRRPRPDQLLFCSRYMRDTTSQALSPPDDVRVIPWGVDTLLFKERPETAPQRVLFAGRLAPHKGVETAIEAVSRLPAAPPLSICGTGPADYHAYLKSRVNALNLGSQVTFLGQVEREQMAEVYAAHDVLVFPSVWEEPFSITVLEALASGMAVVASRTGGTPEVIAHDVTGLLFPASDADACAAALARLIAEPGLAARLGRAGRQEIEKHHRMDAMVAAIERALAAVIGQSGA